MITSNLAQVKINSGGVAPFGQSLPILHPELSPCADRGAFDQYGRPAAPDSIDTMTCPGLFTANTRIEVENSLRPFISPLYFNLPIGISGGADTMFGRVNINRPNAFGNIDVIKAPLVGTEDAFLGARNVDNVAPLVSDIASTYMGNVMIEPDYDTYTLPKGGFKTKYGPKTESFRYSECTPAEKVANGGRCPSEQFRYRYK